MGMNGVAVVVVVDVGCWGVLLGEDGEEGC